MPLTDKWWEQTKEALQELGYEIYNTHYSGFSVSAEGEYTEWGMTPNVVVEVPSGYSVNGKHIPLSVGTHATGGAVDVQGFGWNDQFKWEEFAYKDGPKVDKIKAGIEFISDSDTFHFSVQVGDAGMGMYVEKDNMNAAYLGRKAVHEMLLIKMSGIINPIIAPGIANFLLDYSDKLIHPVYEPWSGVVLKPDTVYDFILVISSSGSYQVVPQSLNNNVEPPPEFYDTFPFLREKAAHPETGALDDIKSIIISLNDIHGYSIERIADWVDELKAQGYDTTAKVEIGENE